MSGPSDYSRVRDVFFETCRSNYCHRGYHLMQQCCPLRATGSSQPCERYLFAPLTGNKERSNGLMVLRVKPTPTRFPTNSLYTPMENTPLHSILSVCQRGVRPLNVWAQGLYAMQLGHCALRVSWIARFKVTYYRRNIPTNKSHFLRVGVIWLVGTD